MSDRFARGDIIDDGRTRGGEVSYDAWYEWYPDYAHDFSGIDISTGDVIKLTVITSPVEISMPEKSWA
jgi:hypothetical protein